eukprot:892780_1
MSASNTLARKQLVATIQAANISRHKKDIISKVVAFEGKDVTDILYECIADIKGINQNEDSKQKDDDDHEQTKDENDEPISILVDINRAKQGMCPKGHCNFARTGRGLGLALCTQCKGRDGFRCIACRSFYFCGWCRKQNMDK